MSQITNGRPTGGDRKAKNALDRYNERLQRINEDPNFHGDVLLADKHVKLTGIWYDLWRVFTPKNAPEIFKVIVEKLRHQAPNVCLLV